MNLNDMIIDDFLTKSDVKPKVKTNATTKNTNMNQFNPSLDFIDELVTKNKQQIIKEVSTKKVVTEPTPSRVVKFANVSKSELQTTKTENKNFKIVNKEELKQLNFLEEAEDLQVHAPKNSTDFDLDESFINRSSRNQNLEQNQKTISKKPKNQQAKVIIIISLLALVFFSLFFVVINLVK